MLSSKIKSHLPRFPWLTAPILRGPLRGSQWALMSRGKTLRYLTGSYEEDQAEFYQESIQPGDVVVDVGANLGYFTLLFSHLVGPTGQVLAFEPSPVVGYYLDLHVRRNRCENVTLFHAALGDKSGIVNFDEDTGTGRGAVRDRGSIEVPQMTLDDVVREQGVTPAFIKIDVEGHGGNVVQGATTTLETHLPTIHFSIHNSAELDSIDSLKSNLNYQLQQDSVGDYVCQPPRSRLQRAA